MFNRVLAVPSACTDTPRPRAWFYNPDVSNQLFFYLWTSSWKKKKKRRQGKNDFLVPVSQFLHFIIQQNLGGIVWYLSRKGKKVFYCQTEYPDLAVIFKPPGYIFQDFSFYDCILAPSPRRYVPDLTVIKRPTFYFALNLDRFSALWKMYTTMLCLARATKTKKSFFRRIWPCSRCFLGMFSASAHWLCCHEPESGDRKRSMRSSKPIPGAGRCPLGEAPS